jgi:anti-sigma B factor antagonist
MKLTLDTRDVGRVTIVKCGGRIVTGGAGDQLRDHINKLLLDRKSLVLNVGEVSFVDSSGLGTMVRALTNARQKGGDLKLCNVTETTRKVLELTSLNKLFESHDSEESAIAAFYHGKTATHQPVQTGPNLLCVDKDIDVLAYLRELLRRAGYDVQTSNNLPDSLILMRVTPFRLVLLGPGMTGSTATQHSFQHSCSKIPVLHLGHEFSGADAGETATKLLETVAESLRSGHGGTAG